MSRFILHCDMNNYFASVEALDNPYLDDVPMAVCGDPELRHGIILSKNELAKKMNVITGESSYEARKKCPNLVLIKPDYKKYLKYAKLSRMIYNEYGKNIYPYGLDESWIELDNITNYTEAAKTGLLIAKRIEQELGLIVSVGLSFNFVFSKLGSDMKLQNKICVIKEEDIETIVWKLPAFELLFVGKSTRSALYKLNILTIGDLAKANSNQLINIFGKKGKQIIAFANGDDSSFNPNSEIDDEIKSLGNTITPPKDIDSFNDAYKFLAILANLIKQRLIHHQIACKTIVLVIRDHKFNQISRQTTIDNYTTNENLILSCISVLLKKNYDFKNGLRSVSIRVTNFSKSSFEQLALIDYDVINNNSVNPSINDLQNKYGNFKIEVTSKTRIGE